MNEVGGLQSIHTVLYTMLEKLNEVDRKEYSGEYELEHKMRLILNILLNFLIYNNDDPSVAREFTNS